MTPADILTGAADLIAEHGKAYGTYRDDDDRVCVVGAMRQVAFGDPFTTPDCRQGTPEEVAYTAARLHLNRYLCGTQSWYARIATWSDSSTTDEVVAVLRAAAEALPKAQVAA